MNPIEILKKLEAAWSKAIKSGDMKKVQKLRDLHFRLKSGSEIKQPVYHGSKKDFNIFDDTGEFVNVDEGYFFSTDPNYSKQFGPVRRFYLNAHKVHDEELPLFRGSLLSHYMSDHDFDADAIKGHDLETPEVLTPSEGTEYVVPRNNQIKSADAVTYDDDGNIIPLSERDNPKKRDVRYIIPTLIGSGLLLNGLFGSNKTTQYKSGGMIRRFRGGAAVTKKTDGPLDRTELKTRQAWIESKFNPRAGRSNGARGLFQIMQPALDYFNNKHKDGRQYTMEDMYDPVNNTDVRNWLFDNLENSSMANKAMSGDSISYAKALGGFNWGRGNMSNALTEAKNAGVDIYDSWDWLPYLPQETRDYINFVLRGQNVNTKKTVANNSDYSASKSKNPTVVKTIVNTKYKK